MRYDRDSAHQLGHLIINSLNKGLELRFVDAIAGMAGWISEEDARRWGSTLRAVSPAELSPDTVWDAEVNQLDGTFVITATYAGS